MGLYLIADVTLVGVLGVLWTILKVLIGLGLVIFVHELGHFLVAKACGVKCEKFYVGFDVPLKIGRFKLPRTLGKVQWGETEYGVGIIPLGGYVKMLGQDDDPRNAAREAERIKVRAASAEGGEYAANSEEESFELDPRSYPAKSVPQRMAIISAGVIMNLIFAVIFATIAYSMGVSYTSCEIAGTAPGDPAWVANLQPGDKIIQIGRDGEPDEHLRFDWELRQRVVQSGIGDKVEPMELLIRGGDAEPRWISITPTDRLKEHSGYVTLGVRPPRSTQLSSTMPVLEHMSAGKVEPPLQGSDRIVAVNGEPLPRDEETGEIFIHELERQLARFISEPVTLTVERRGEPSAGGQPQLQTLDVVVSPNPTRWLGLIMKMGPVVAVRRDSPAEKAGFQVGDVIVKINGEPVGDPMTLPQRLTALDGQEVEFEIERKQGEGENRKTVQLSVAPQGPPVYLPHMGRGSRMSLETVGVAYGVGHVVDAVQPDTPAAKAGMQAGDKVVRVRFESTGPEMHTEAVKLFGKQYNATIEIDDDISNWPYVHGFLQELFPEMQVTLVYERDGRQESATLVPRQAEGQFYATRGFNTVAFKRVHTAESIGEAISLGFRETKEKLLEVFGVLRLLVTGQLSPKNLGGPIMIAAVAGSEASQGVPRLLLFLTFLSANLAILNFLPIPALDGGHMVFLTAEAIIGRPVDERLQGTLTLIGVMCLLGLIIFVCANDIGRIFL